MHHNKLYLFLFSVFFLQLSAQENKDNFEENFNRAEKIFSKVYQKGKTQAFTYYKGAFADARPIFLELYKKDSSNQNLAFKIGVCYLYSKNEKAKSIAYFSKAVSAASFGYRESSHKERKSPLITHKFLGDALHLNYEFDKAILAYEKFKASMVDNEDIDRTLLAETNQRIEMCKSGKLLMLHPVNVQMKNLGTNVNSSFADYSPVLTADQQTLFFTSRRPETIDGQKDVDGNFLEDIYMCTKTKNGWSKAENIGAPVNTENHEATVGISPDGQTILIYKDDAGDGNIYSTSLSGDKWTSPVKLNDNINSKFWEPSASISADGNSLYFTSDRPGGYGGRDLYLSKRLPRGDWAAAVNLGPEINSQYDEDAPFIHPDGVTLSFSSNGHNTMGGFDIFTSTRNPDGKWNAAENAGYPVNTTDDDIFFVLSSDGRTAYFSSFREGGSGEKDNYELIFTDRKEIPLTLMKGNIITATGQAAKNAEITVTDNETEEVLGVYMANSKTGKFLFILSPGKNYNITFQAEGDLFYSQNMDIPIGSDYYVIRQPVLMNAIVVGSKIILNNIFFDFDKSSLQASSNVELKNLTKLLRTNPNLKVEISGHTDSKGTNEYNQKLSEERAQAVVQKLIDNGIEANRLIAKGYGKSKPIVKNSKKNGKDNPAGRQQNRRVELIITQIN